MWIKRMFAFLALISFLFMFAQPASAGTSNIACYFYNTNSDSTTWEWALTENNNYYEIYGDWRKTPFTKLMKFFPSNPANVSYGDICIACDNAKTYNNLGDNYDFFAFFAATSNSGSNYPVVLDGVEFFPDN
ncbi:MAG: hypothetical protein EBE86_020610 [Hormoscilla sp. GUM202]|nr:hypothetical protein [Hormoscilla sp. GUM202]